MILSDTATLPPPATAAAQSTRPSGGRRLVHICAVHHGDDPACPGPGCVAYCGHRWAPGARQAGTTDDPVSPDDCLVCLDLWRAT